MAANAFISERQMLDTALVFRSVGKPAARKSCNEDVLNFKQWRVLSAYELNFENSFDMKNFGIRNITIIPFMSEKPHRGDWRG